MVDYRALINDDSVHASLHADEQVFADEMDLIFTRGWVFVGHESEVPEPGDWVTRRLGAEPVIMVRDRDDQVHVVANRCSHRGTALCWEAKGNSPSFQCTYHAWTFGLDGSLRSVPYPGGFDKDKADLGLDIAGQVDSHRGFVFANLDGSAGPLAEHLGDGGTGMLDRLCDLSPTGKIDLSKGWLGHKIGSNWKLWPESDNDGYHLNWVHASMVTATPDTYYQETILGGETGNSSMAVDWGRGHIELDMRPSYQQELAWLGTSRDKVAAYAAALTESRGKQRADQLMWDGPPHAFIFPNLFLGEMSVAIIEPVSPKAMVHRHTAVQLEGVEPAFNRRLLRQSEAAMGPAAFIVPDDAVTAERIQSAVTGLRPSTADNAKGWIDMSRGLNRESKGEAGRTEALISDETTNRGFWRQYRTVMTGTSQP
ncbi:MAG: phenylpropionate dioxygenase-like ring-hydroxylating dioxygenase large terminal subunit [Candidatus Poriferisodalaceae bacterium]|jgi:phenylpropionate dioxygenase-like ring-hydroxylating dioxygenase large terminal subunit